MTSATTTEVTGRENFLKNVGKHEKARIIKNVTLISVAFMLHFTAFHGTANLQSSIHLETGTYTLLSIYGSLLVANIFLPVLVIRYLGCKWTIAFAFITYMPFVAAQFYPIAGTLIPSGIAVGLGGAALWCAKATYLTIIAEAYNCLTGDKIKSNVLVVRFFGFFYFFFQMAQVWGNLISSSVLSMNSPPRNESDLPEIMNSCGANFCPGTSTSDDNPYLVQPDPERINLLSGIFLGCMAGAVLLVAFGVDSLKRYDLGRTGSGGGLAGFELLGVTVKQLLVKKQILLIPVTIFIGFDHAIINADFTSAFVACGWGISNIGYAMMCFGIANAIGSALTGLLSKIVGRFTVVSTNACVHVALLIWLITWQPVPDGLLYCLIAAVWGAVNGIWLVQINALSGILFPGNEEAAFSSFRLIECIGSVVGYAISPLFCMEVKLWTMLAIILISMCGYGTVEYMELKTKQKESQDVIIVGEYKQKDRY